MDYCDMKLIFLLIVTACSALASPILTILPNDGGSVQCYGDVVQLVCTHPVLEPSDYFVTALWEMNGMEFGPDGMNINETTKSASTSLRIHLTRELFDSKEIIFRCFLLRRDFTEEYSNEVIVDPLEKPLRPNIKKVQPQMSFISLTWEHDPVCFEDYIYYFTISWCTVENGVPDVSTCKSTTTSTTDITLSNLVPSTTYQVNITAQSVENSTIRSDAVERDVTTLDTDIGVQDGNTTESSGPGGADTNNITFIILGIWIPVLVVVVILVVLLLIRRRHQQYNIGEMRTPPHTDTSTSRGITEPKQETGAVTYADLDFTRNELKLHQPNELFHVQYTEIGKPNTPQTDLEVDKDNVQRTFSLRSTTEPRAPLIPATESDPDSKETKKHSVEYQNVFLEKGYKKHEDLMVNGERDPIVQVVSKG